MPTSRTGTAKWKQLRLRTLSEARANGLRHCPLCAIPLNYAIGRQPDSAEVDHVIPAAYGGQDSPDNVRVICRHCNQSRGNKPDPRTPPVPKTVTNLVRW